MHKLKSDLEKNLFDYQFERFKKHVMDESGNELKNVSSCPYIKKQEGYKEEIYYQARNLLNFESWSILDVGNGNIIKSVIAAIEIKENNLVQWQPRYGEDSSQHQPLRDELTNGKKLIVYEKDLFNLYRDTDDKKTFEKLVNIFGHRYPIIAYLFFLKDKKQYMPIAPTYFDKAFKTLGINLITRTHLKNGRLRSNLSLGADRWISKTNNGQWSNLYFRKWNAERMARDVREWTTVRS